LGFPAGKLGQLAIPCRVHRLILGVPARGIGATQMEIGAFPVSPPACVVALEVVGDNQASLRRCRGRCRLLCLRLPDPAQVATGSDPGFLLWGQRVIKRVPEGLVMSACNRVFGVAPEGDAGHGR
jgi:hypothetical protein